MTTRLAAYATDATCTLCAGPLYPCDAGHSTCVECERKALARKDAVLTAVNAAAPADVKARIDAAILKLAATGRPFSANDCRSLFPDVKGAVIGGRFNALGHAGRIRKTGDRVPSTLGNTNGHEIHVWRAA